MSTPRRSISVEPRSHETKNVKKKEEIVSAEAKKPRAMSTPRRSISYQTDITSKGSEARKSLGARRSISSETESEAKKSFGGGKDKGIARTESARFFRQLPSSPSKILNMRKGVDCIRKKPLVVDDDEDYNHIDENHSAGDNFLKSSIKSIKKAVKI
ncbi:uncharacterized protein LOC110698716 [Chenopodium quinoa]|uniref:uncharacterized protein LOC110698716 n=1 Tax=Chenopodium quinoa TaxID=63459 RepID=UPI000B77128F|nr:uncharacterized protein LOC110698716 [Chenopodium quinoa]